MEVAYSGFHIRQLITRCLPVAYYGIGPLGGRRPKGLTAVRRSLIDTRDIALVVRMHPCQFQMLRHTKDPEALEQHEGGTSQNADPRDVSEQEDAGAAEHLPVAVKGAAGTYPVQSVALSGTQWHSAAISAGTYPAV